MAVLGFSQVNTPLVGGVLVPSPDRIFLGTFSTNASGQLNLASVWPAGVPSSTRLYLQFWIPDPAASEDWAVSNALQLTTP